MKTVAIASYTDRVPNYLAALDAMGLSALVTLDPEEAAACDGLLLPGGGDIAPDRFGQPDQCSRNVEPAMDQAQLDTLDRFVRAGKPVLGICRGMQVLNVYFGGDLIQDLPTAADHMAYDHVDSIHPVTNEPERLLHRLYGPDMQVNSSHHQGVGRLGRDLRAIAYAPAGVVEALEHLSLPILGVQFHPERMAFSHARPDTADGSLIFQWFKQLL